MKHFCANCGKEIKYSEIPDGSDLAFPVKIQNQETGKIEDGIICLKCGAKANKETGGGFLGVGKLEDLDFSHYLADCDNLDCKIEHKTDEN